MREGCETIKKKPRELGRLFFFSHTVISSVMEKLKKGEEERK